METFELRYFLGVARTENIHRASERLRVSPASLSKAVSRIEAELGTRLFTREGRNIRLTEQGRYLKEKAVEILRMEESVRTEIGGRASQVRCVIAGPEVLLAHFGLSVVAELRKSYPEATIEYQACGDARAIEKVRGGDANLGIVSGEIPRELTAKLLGESEFKTVVGRGHPLHAKAQGGRAIAVAEVLKHGFACPESPWLGQVGRNQSADGWRDDQFPRRITHQTSSLKLLESLVTSGEAVAYLPDYLVRSLGLSALKMSGCPYHCTQKIRLIAHRPKNVSWLSRLF